MYQSKEQKKTQFFLLFNMIDALFIKAIRVLFRKSINS